MADKCNTCKHNPKFGGDGWSVCDGCIHDESLKDRYEAATNGDRIRAMTDEQLAKTINGLVEESGKFCRELSECGEDLDNDRLIPEERCQQCVLAWLREEAEDG